MQPVPNLLRENTKPRKTDVIKCIPAEKTKWLRKRTIIQGIMGRWTKRNK